MDLAGLSQVLSEATGITAVAAEHRPNVRASVAVRLDQAVGAKTTQRLSLQATDDCLALCTWPAELKPQAEAMYRAARVARFLGFVDSDEHLWTALPNLHLAYRSAPAQQRLYLGHQLDIHQYVPRWLGDDFARVGAHGRDLAWPSLWPWLLKRGYAGPPDEDRFADFLGRLGKHPILLRPGIALEHRWLWAANGKRGMDHAATVAAVRTAVTQVLTALDEPLPPACTRPVPRASDLPKSAGQQVRRSGVTPEDLEDVLIDRARWTYTRMTAGSRHGVELHETTVTQDLLLDISMALPALDARTFTTRQESRNGADWQWEWWFEGRQWFGLRVQAKRLKRLPSGHLGYDLGYKLRGRPPKRQIDLLINDAATSGLPAAYVLYNGLGLDPIAFDWRCERLPSKAAFFGVSLLPATAARALVDAGRDDFASVATASAPWSCLAACGWSGCSPEPKSKWRDLAVDSEGPGLSEWISASYDRIRQSAYGAHGDLVPEADGPQEGNNLPFVLPDRPPAYVTAILNGDATTEPQLPPRVGSVTVFQAGR